MKKLFSLIVLVLIVGFSYSYYTHRVTAPTGPIIPTTPTATTTPTTPTIPVTPGDGGMVACTMDAKMCPDGSYVGRTGPKCEFTACPPVSVGGTITRDIPYHEIAVFSDMIITPFEILEESRCPSDVQCIQAGRVQVTVNIGTKSVSATGENVYGKATPFVFSIGTKETFAGHTIELIDVKPYPISTKRPSPSEYVFTFKVSTL